MNFKNLNPIIAHQVREDTLLKALHSETPVLFICESERDSKLVIRAGVSGVTESPEGFVFEFYLADFGKEYMFQGLLQGHEIEFFINERLVKMIEGNKKSNR